MNPPEPEVVQAAPQPAPPRKSRAGVVGLVVGLLVVLAGLAAAYYYVWYLPATPKVVLARYLALEQKGDADGTYRFLSEKSRKMFTAETWKMAYANEAVMRAQVSITHSLGQPKYRGDECRIPVTMRVSWHKPPAGMSPKMASQKVTEPYILVREKTGWKVGAIEQMVELQLEKMRKMGYKKEQIEQARKQMTKMLEAGPKGPR